MATVLYGWDYRFDNLGFSGAHFHKSRAHNNNNNNNNNNNSNPERDNWGDPNVDGRY